jgi:hypothetical protein
MLNASVRQGILGGSLLLSLSASLAPVRFAAPEIMIFHGRGLAKPVAIASWQENQTILVSGERRINVDQSAGRSVTPLRQRPYLEIALFWGTGWRQLAQSRGALDSLSPSRADQRGRYYPRHHGAAAQIVLNGVPRVLSDSALAILRRHGVPPEM